jgi:hypothetical protein
VTGLAGRGGGGLPVLIRMHFEDATNDAAHFDVAQFEVGQFEVVGDPAVTVQHSYRAGAAWHYPQPRDEYQRRVAGRQVEPRRLRARSRRQKPFRARVRRR